MISFVQKGNFDKLESFLKNSLKFNYMSILEQYARQGVDILESQTPVDTGKTASSWKYEITKQDGKITISWLNSNVKDDVNIAVLIQYGHGTGNGGYVQGVDYINPALKPIFDKLANDVWKGVVR